MINALWTGISGLDAHQTALDNTAHNIANVNTIGYKASRISFADQLYQDKIGKGSIVGDAEKIFSQGTINPTGVAYDVALNGNGFFVVSDERNGGGTAQTFYTRAGNLRVGENGTLQDALGNEVQGWFMTPIDTDADIYSSNPNITRFTADYTQRIDNAVIKHGTFIETITAITTDYATTSKSDALTVFTGAGYKSESAKITDIEELQKAYSAALQAYSDNPDGFSSSSRTQTSFIDFEDILVGTPPAPSTFQGEGDVISVFINGTNISQEWTVDYVTSMKQLADNISAITGLKAYTVDAALNESTTDANVGLGIIKIESIIPGEAFTIGDVTSISGVTEVDGTEILASRIEPVLGTGLAALVSVRERLADAVSGKQRDVNTDSELFTIPVGGAITGGYQFDFRVTIWDNNLKANITLPNAAALPITTTAAAVTGPLAIAEVAAQINADPELSAHIFAEVVNGHLVIETLDGNSDVEFNAVLDRTVNPDVAANIGVVDKNALLSGREGASAELLEMITTVDQTTTRDSLQLQLTRLGISDVVHAEFSVDEKGIITMRQNGNSFAVGQLAVARFSNDRGLEAIGGNLFEATNESGRPQFTLNNNGETDIQGRSLELSEADLGDSLVNLIVFQRAFEANSKSITTADQLLTTLINLKQ